jgi:hypothetical protein
LCHVSDYFAGAFRSGMKEAGTKGFEFPDKDPMEWGLLSHLFQPFLTRQITTDNVFVVLPWCDFLEVPGGLLQCDLTSHQSVNPPMPEDFDELVSLLAELMEHSWTDPKLDGIKALDIEDAYYDQRLLEFFEDFLSSSNLREDQDGLFSNRLALDLIMTKSYN